MWSNTYTGASSGNYDFQADKKSFFKHTFWIEYYF